MNRFSLPAPIPRDRLTPLKIALYYGLAAALWILLSDGFLRLMTNDSDQISRLQTAKGWLFVLVSALWLYALVRHYLGAVLRREEELLISEASFRSVFQTAAAGMVIIQLDGTIIRANPAFCRFLGYREAELITLTVTDITHPEDRDITWKNLLSLSAGHEESVHYEKRFLTRDGRTMWGHASVACLLGDDHSPPFCIGMVQDISKRKAAEVALKESNQELEAFVYTVSHDLRSPLTPIVGYAAFLRERCRDRLDEEERQCLAEIVRSGNRMLEVMEELLTLARIGQIERPDEPVNASTAVSEVLADLNETIGHAGVLIEVGELPAVRMPKSFLTLLFGNLIGNALRYGCTNGGCIAVGGKRHEGRVYFFVIDHGAGIPAAERDRIFDLFYRGSNGNGTKGTGIGLATVQKIARLFDGRTWVEETPGGGSTFWVELNDSAVPSAGDAPPSMQPYSTSRSMRWSGASHITATRI